MKENSTKMASSGGYGSIDELMLLGEGAKSTRDRKRQIRNKFAKFVSSNSNGKVCILLKLFVSKVKK